MSHKASLKDNIGHAVEDFARSTENFIAERWHHRLHRRARHHVHKLRQRPNKHKEIMAFSFAFVITAIIFVLWYSFSLPKIFGEYYRTRAENERLDRSANPLTDFQSMYKEAAANNIDQFTDTPE